MGSPKWWHVHGCNWSQQMGQVTHHFQVVEPSEPKQHGQEKSHGSMTFSLWLHKWLATDHHAGALYLAWRFWTGVCLPAKNADYCKFAIEWAYLDLQVCLIVAASALGFNEYMPTVNILPLMDSSLSYQTMGNSMHFQGNNPLCWWAERDRVRP